jgi:hypothetical protein
MSHAGLSVHRGQSHRKDAQRESDAPERARDNTPRPVRAGAVGPVAPEPSRAVASRDVAEDRGRRAAEDSGRRLAEDRGLDARRVARSAPRQAVSAAARQAPPVAARPAEPVTRRPLARASARPSQGPRPTASTESEPARGASRPAGPTRPSARGGTGVPGRRTVTIQGRGSERYSITPARRRPPRTLHERARFHPDRVAMWAVLLGVLLVLAAATSSHAAVLGAHAANGTHAAAAIVSASR